MIKNEKNTVYDVKRLIGRKYNDVIVQNVKKLWNFQITGEASTEIPNNKIDSKYFFLKIVNIFYVLNVELILMLVQFVQINQLKV